MHEQPITRVNYILLLVKEEFYSFIKGIQWFGLKKKWNVISKYFVPNRTPEYLEELVVSLINRLYKSMFNILDYEKNEKLKKKKIIKNDSDYEKAIITYTREFRKELNSIYLEILNYNSKNNFFFIEKPYEKLILADNKLVEGKKSN